LHGSGLKLFPLKYQFIILHRHFDFIAGFEFASEQLRGERVEQMFLNRSG
jgi:hypothetical protein